MSSITDGDLRRSAVESFGCPYRYEQIHLKGVDDTGDEAVRGRAFHAAAYVYIYRLAAKQLTADHEEAQLALRDGIRITGCPDQLVAHVERLFYRWAEGFRLDLDAFLEAEELKRRGRRTFRPDLVYCRPSELELIDFKTYYKGLTEQQAREELQLRWYLVEAMQVWPGFPRYRFTFVFVRLNFQVSLTFTPEEIEAFEPAVQGAIDAVVQAEEQGQFPALPGSHCSLCRIECPVVDAPQRLPMRIVNEAQALDVFGQVLALEQRVKQLKKVLGAFVKVEGPLALRGQVYQHLSSDSRRFPMDLVAKHVPEADRQHGITISAQALKTIWRRTTDMPGDLLDGAVVRRSWRFKHGKAGEAIPDGLVDVLDEGGDDGEDGDG